MWTGWPGDPTSIVYRSDVGGDGREYYVEEVRVEKDFTTIQTTCTHIMSTTVYVRMWGRYNHKQRASGVCWGRVCRREGAGTQAMSSCPMQVDGMGADAKASGPQLNGMTGADASGGGVHTAEPAGPKASGPQLSRMPGPAACKLDGSLEQPPSREHPDPFVEEVD